MDWKTWLENRHSPSTAKAYSRDINIFLQATPNAANADYSELMAYIKRLRTSQKPASVHRILQSIKKYYIWLQQTEQRPDNPSAAIRLKDHQKVRAVQLQDLLTTQQLETVWQHFLNKKYRYKAMRTKLLVALSLLLFQALSTEEIVNLTLEQLDLEQGILRLPGSNLRQARNLPLAAEQILLLHHYTQEKRLECPSTLVFSQLSMDSLHYLISSGNPLKGKKLSPLVLRQSVIAAKFALGWDLRKVQLFAGHLRPSSTEVYRLSGLEALRLSIEKHHPLS